MSRPTPRSFYEAKLDKAMQSNDTNTINSTMKKLQGLKKPLVTQGDDIKRSPVKTKEAPKRRRRGPIAEPRPTLMTKEDTPRRRRRPTADPRPTSPRRRRRPTSEAQRQRQAILRRRALARQRARQRALLRGTPKGGDPRTRGQIISPTMKRALEQAAKRKNVSQRAKTLGEQKLKQLTKQRNARSIKGKNLIAANRKKLMKLTGGRNLLSIALKNSRKKKT